MKERNLVLPVFMLLLLAGAVFLLVRFYPVWKAAAYVQENLDPAHFSYELEVELDQEKVQGSQGKLFEVLTGLTGFTESDLYSLTLKGNVWEDRIHLLIYPRNAENPLIELYLGDDTDVINETMIYNTIRNHLAEKLGVLSFIMPEQKETLYMTLEQVEQIFGIDLNALRDFRLQTEGDRPVTIQYFLMMAAMSREKTEGWNRFALEREQLALQIEVPAAEHTGTMQLRLDVQDPVELLEKETALLDRLHIPAGSEQLKPVKRLSVRIAPGGEEISMPTDLVNQSVVELISGIREWVMKLGGGSETEPGSL